LPEGAQATRFVVIYIFGLLVFYLAGVYLGGVLLIFFFAALLLPFLSFAFTLSAFLKLRYHQDFSNDHPRKGETVEYRLSVKNEGLLPSSPILLRFRGGRVDDALGLAEHAFSLLPSRSYGLERRIRCPYRGIYTVGLERLAVADQLGWLRLPLPVFSRTFYVYPRILNLDSLNVGSHADAPRSRSLGAGREEDNTLFRGVRTFQDGDDPRYIHWRKFASLGVPLVRSFDTAAEPGVSLVLDTRPVPADRGDPLAVEDSSIEIALSLARRLMRLGVPCSFLVEGRPPVELIPGLETTFEELHRESINFFFRAMYAPSTLLGAYRESRREAGRSAVFVTHILDPELLTLVGAGRPGVHQTGVVLNGLGLEAQPRAEGGLAVVRSADSLNEDLKGWAPG
jgi:uncharacterized protein (DUF58 family)